MSFLEKLKIKSTGLKKERQKSSDEIIGLIFQLQFEEKVDKTVGFVTGTKSLTNK
jgi:hypothetical protein